MLSFARCQQTGAREYTGISTLLAYPLARRISRFSLPCYTGSKFTRRLPSAPLATAVQIRQSSRPFGRQASGFPGPNQYFRVYGRHDNRNISHAPVAKSSALTMAGRLDRMNGCWRTELL